MPHAYSLIFNPSSGGGRGSKIAADAAGLLEARGADCESTATESLEHAEELARAAVRRGRVVLACGGDGVIGAIARGVAGEGGLMALVPGGRGNDLARALGVPTGTADAVDVALGGREQLIDLGTGNGVSFCCIASCGYDSDANRLANEDPGTGSTAYIKAAIRALREWKPATFTVTLDGVESSFTGYSVVVANSCAYGGGMRVAPDADPKDGILDVVTIGDSPKWEFLMRFPLVFLGRHTRSRSVTVQRARRVEISADRQFDVYADGDPLCPLPAVIEVQEAAVRILLPR